MARLRVVSAQIRLLVRFSGSVAVILMASGGPLPTCAQIGPWKAHTSMRSVTDLTRSSGTVWVATTGGVFRVNAEDGIDGTLTAVEGLHAVGGSTIAYDQARTAVWLGYSDGVLDRIDETTLQVTSFLDISRASQFTRKGINRIVVHGDSLLVCTDFGVVVFDPTRGEVRDSYSAFGSFAAASAAFDIAVAPDDDGRLTFWVATEAGLAFAAVDSPNLQDPSEWTNEYPPTASLRSVAYYGGNLFVGTTSGVYGRGQDGSYASLPFPTREVRQLGTFGDVLVGNTDSGVIIAYADGSTSSFGVQGFSSPRAVQALDGRLWVGDAKGGVVVLQVPPPGTTASVPAEQDFIPEGPYNGIFSDLHAASDGALWAAGILGGDMGFHRLGPDGVWSDYVESLVPALAGRGSYTSVSTDALATGWAASEGSGAAHVNEAGDVEVFDEANSSLRAATGFPGFIIVGGVAGDSQGGMWFTTRGSPTPLHYRSPDGVWYGLPPMVGEGLTSGATAYGRIYIDSFGQKWIIVREESSFGLVKGLAVLDTGTSPSDPSDDSFRFFGTRGGGGQGLPGRSVTAVVEDRDGLVWIGTQEGLAFFVNTGVVARDPNVVAIWPQRADRSEGAFLYLGLPVNDLAVDPANRLWIATNDGVRLIEAAEGGYREVAQVTQDNSPLLSNVVLAVEVAADRGEVFFATAEGLVSAKIDAVTAAPTVRDLFVYPNPALIGGSEGASGVTIEGLVDETQMSIVSPLGETIASVRTRGGRAVWDLRDVNGSLVPSGVYLVIAVGENGEGTAFGKIAVIR